MLTSVIMVSYQTGPVLLRSVMAVLAQTAPVELLLVDNGNPPDMLTKLQVLAARDPRLKVITGHGNVGFSKGCNLGAKAGQGAHLLFLNPDGLLPIDAAAKLHAHAATLASPYMIGARLLNEDGTDQRGCRRALLTPTTAFIEALHLHTLFPKARLNFNHEPVPDHITSIPAISGAFMFLPAANFWRIGGFDEGYFLHVEDLDLCLRFRRAGGKIYFAPDIIVTHIGGTSGATSVFVERHKARGFRRYFHQNFRDSPKVLLWALDVAAWARTELRLFVR